jgi:hypothetical protein
VPKLIKVPGVSSYKSRVQPGLKSGVKKIHSYVNAIGFYQTDLIFPANHFLKYLLLRVVYYLHRKLGINWRTRLKLLIFL